MEQKDEMNDELKPCPFCGGKVIVFYNHLSARWIVEHEGVADCFQFVSLHHNRYEAIELWNRREA